MYLRILRLSKVCALGIAVALAFSVALSTSLLSNESMKTFELPAQTLSKALVAFSRQSGVIVFAPSQLTKGKTSGTVEGELAPTEALKMLLNGTGLNYTREADGSFIIGALAKKLTRNRVTKTRKMAQVQQTEPPEKREGATEAAKEELVLEEIVVTTARLRAEDLQEVPDAVTVFTSADIDSAGIDEIQDFFDLTPNMILRTTFRSGAPFITIRGITSTQQGWPPVTYIVDGVKAGTLDAFNQGALFDIEHIEILKGPQGALYGAGAIAGAINVTTKSPTDEFEGRARLSYGKGNDVKLSTAVSGPIVKDKLLFRAGVYYRNTDGLVNSTDGEDIDFEDLVILRGRLLFMPTEDLTFDLRGAFTHLKGGVATQDAVSSADLIDEFGSAAAPGPERGIVGKENRQFIDLSLKADWDIDLGTFTLVAGYQKIDQELFGTTSWARPPTNLCFFCPFFGPLFGDAAAPGQAIDGFQNFEDPFEIYTQDIRFTSRSDQRLRYVGGIELLERTSITRLGLGRLIAPLPGTRLFIFNRFDLRKDNFLGFYGQVNYDVTDRLELTLAGRYDRNNYSTGQIVGSNDRTPIQTVDVNGNLVDRLFVKDSKFQPKATLAYSWTDNFMTYATFARGFRSGFFSVGNRTKAETTSNYEIGFKSDWFDRALIVNASGFHTDFSNQQFTVVVATPPFRITQNIESTDINGFELEVRARPTRDLELIGSVGHTDAEVNDGTRAPATPSWTLNGTVQTTTPLAYNLNLVTRVDYRYQSGLFLQVNEVFRVPGKSFVNARVSIESNNWSLRAFVDNLLNTRMAIDFTLLSGKFIRSYNEPVSFGLEAAYKF